MCGHAFFPRCVIDSILSALHQTCFSPNLTLTSSIFHTLRATCDTRGHTHSHIAILISLLPIFLQFLLHQTFLSTQSPEVLKEDKEIVMLRCKRSSTCPCVPRHPFHFASGKLLSVFFHFSDGDASVAPHSSIVPLCHGWRWCLISEMEKLQTISK